MTEPDSPYRWWTFGWWNDADGRTLKLGPVSLYRSHGYVGVCLFNRWPIERELAPASDRTGS